MDSAGYRYCAFSILRVLDTASVWMLPNTTLLQRSARTTVEAGPRYYGLGLRNGPGTCVVP